MKRLLYGLCVACLLAGCASTPTSFYQLQAQLESRKPMVMGKRVLVGPVNLPASLNRPQLVIDNAAGQPELLEFQRWSAPLDRLLAQSIATNLSRQLGLASIYAYPQAGMDGGDIKLLLDVRQLSLAVGRQAQLEIAWQAVSVAKGEVLASGYFQQNLALTDASIPSAVAGLQQLVNRFSQQLAQQLTQKNLMLLNTDAKAVAE